MSEDKSLEENFEIAQQAITPSSSISGMGEVSFPDGDTPGSGDVPAVADIDDDEEEAKKDKTKKKLEMENFNLYTQFNSFVGESLVSEAFKFGKKNQYSIDDVNESYGFWGTLDTAGFRRKDIEDCWHSAMAWLTEAYKFSDPGALYYLNAKAGRWIADQVVEQKGNKDVVDVLEDYATDAEWKKWSKEYNKFAQEELAEANTIYERYENPVRDLHFETDPERAEELKIEIGISQGEVTRKKQIEGGDYSLRRFRKEIKYDTTGEDLGVFKPGSYMAATSTLGDGPHKKAVKKIKWNLKKYNQWLEDVASNGGWENAYDMAQNAKHEPGLLDWAKKEFRGEDVMQRIQWDIEAFAESTDTKKLTWDSLKEALGINEAKKMSIGDQGVDYNDNVVEIVAIGNFKKIAKMFKKEMKADAADWGYEEGAGDFYLTKNIEATEGNVGDLAIYPVKYDMANYWGLDPLEESKVNEGRSINKISKEHSAVVLDMSNTVKEWKEAEGDRKSDLLEKLRGLNKRKAELEKELDQAVAGKDSEVELALSESEVNEKDDAGTHLDNLADLVGNAKSFMNVGKELKAGNYKYDFSTGMMPMYMIHADGFKFAILNKKYVDGGDREVGDIAIGLMEAVDLKKKVEALNEGLRNDLKKFIKKNQKELDRLADLEEWERLYLMLYTEFDVEPESDEAKEVKDAFDLTY